MCCKRVSHAPGRHTPRVRMLMVAYRLKDINENCLEEFRAHWNCLENFNHQLFQCRRPERVLNRCVFQKIVRQTFPGGKKMLTELGT